MGAEDYYWTRNLIRGFGKMWFLLAPQEAESATGGKSLLGSIVQELPGGFLGLIGLRQHYPAPYNMTEPQIVLTTLAKKQGDLGIGGPIVEPATLIGPAQSFTINKKDSLKAGAGPFPSLPVSLNLDIDYSRMKSITVQFGDTARALYIPTDYLARLYKSFDGDWRKLDPHIVIDVSDNYIVDQVLLAKDFTVTFESESDFDAEFSAKVDALAKLGSPNVTVKVGSTAKNHVTAEVRGDTEYLIGFKVIDWDDLG